MKGVRLLLGNNMSLRSKIEPAATIICATQEYQEKDKFYFSKEQIVQNA